MGNGPSWKRDFFHGFGTPKLNNERFPLCLRPARRGYEQADLKLHHPTTCSVLKRKQVLVDFDTVFGGEEMRIAMKAVDPVYLLTISNLTNLRDSFSF